MAEHPLAILAVGVDRPGDQGQQLRANKRLQVTATGKFALVSGATISASRTITLLT